MEDLMEKLVSLCKRRGFIFPASEIYGGLGGTYTYGPYGVELKNNIKALWWKMFVRDRADMVGIDGPIILNQKVWEASGHVAGFNDALADCKSCKKRFRADHIIKEATGKDLEGDLVAMTAALHDGIKCPNCGKSNWTEVRVFNTMFSTKLNATDDSGEQVAYLRPETAGAIFIEFKNIMDSMRPKLPFGIGQMGKAFRNEIVAGNFIFRLREFEQMEIEYFIRPDADWEQLFNHWLELQEAFAQALGIPAEKLRRREHAKEKLSHYSRKTVDIEFAYPFGGDFEELFGLAHRGDFDLTQHSKFSGEKLEYYDQEKNERFVPHVLEPTFGLDRSILATLLSAYHEEEVNGETRVVMQFPKKIAPVQVAVLPLSKNDELSPTAQEVFNAIKDQFVTEYDETQSIGKRYRRQDEIGTPYCVTVDFESMTDKKVTVRDRDTMSQERIAISELASYLQKQFFL